MLAADCVSAISRAARLTLPSRATASKTTICFRVIFMLSASNDPPDARLGAPGRPTRGQALITLVNPDNRPGQQAFRQ